MQYLLIFTVLFCLVSYGLANGYYAFSTENQSIEDDLKELNASCEVEDRCQGRPDDDSLSSYRCHCGPYCIQLETCCFDSAYIGVLRPTLKSTCRATYNGKPYFMIDRCPSNDSGWEHSCRKEWNGEDDILQIVPVTSLFTSKTYKNYFCFRCNEANDEFVYWDVKLEADLSKSDMDAWGLNPPYDGKEFPLKYDNHEKTWVTSVASRNNVQIPVKLSVKPPNDIWLLKKDCDLDVISTCSDMWPDVHIREKCQAYMSTKQVRKQRGRLYYKNIHCALCNFENLPDVTCKDFPYVVADFHFFSFTHLLDINRSDGDLVGKTRMCTDDQVWDPFAKKCRKMVCALPGYRVKDRKCVKD